MTTIPRPGFFRVGEERSNVIRLPRRQRQGCASGKQRHPSEQDALAALMRVRVKRAGEGGDRLPENRIYPCTSCAGWHLTSRELHRMDLETPHERNDTEPWDKYARRLEKKIAAQRAEIVSLLALGHGGSNRELRKRVPALLGALAHMTERWNGERQNRIAVVETLRRKHPLCWLLWRVTLGRRAT